MMQFMKILRKKFLDLLKLLNMLSDWKIPIKLTKFLWSETQEFQIHAFGDASPLAYETCVYLCMRSSDGEWSVRQIFARA